MSRRSRVRLRLVAPRVGPVRATGLPPRRGAFSILAPKSGCKRPDAAGKQRPARGAPALRVPSLPGGSHGSMWSGQTGAPRCVGLRGSPPAIRFLGRSGGVLGPLWARRALKLPIGRTQPRWLGCHLRATVKLLTMGIWRLVMEKNRLSCPSGCPLGVSQPFQILGRFALIGLCSRLCRQNRVKNRQKMHEKRLRNG
jgi:hypothetical protein